MIIQVLVVGVISFLQLLLGVINIPQYGTEVSSALSFITGIVMGSTQFLVYWLSLPIFLFCFGAIFAAINANWVFAVAKFVFDKIPWINVRL